jgi:hypothetical protein
MRGDERTEAASAQASRALVVLSPEFGPIAKATTWLLEEREGQRLIAVPQLRVEQAAAFRIITGTGLAQIFQGCILKTAEWEEAAGFVGGAWQLWNRSMPDLANSGFVLGTQNFDIEKAVRGLSIMLR